MRLEGRSTRWGRSVPSPARIRLMPKNRGEPGGSKRGARADSTTHGKRQEGRSGTGGGVGWEIGDGTGRIGTLGTRSSAYLTCRQARGLQPARTRGPSSLSCRLRGTPARPAVVKARHEHRSRPRHRKSLSVVVVLCMPGRDGGPPVNLAGPSPGRRGEPRDGPYKQTPCRFYVPKG